MSHIPVNHPLRPLYRVLVALAGLYVFLFGLVGFIKTRGLPTFDQSGTWVLGLRTNGAFALISIVAGLVILAAVALGRNIDRLVNLAGSVVFMVVGLAMLLVMGSGANVLNFSMSTCVVSLALGTLLLTAGLYGKVDRQVR